MLGLCWDRTQDTVHTKHSSSKATPPARCKHLIELTVFWIPGFWKLLTQVLERNGPSGTSLLFWQICFSPIHPGHQPSEVRTVHSSPDTSATAVLVILASWSNFIFKTEKKKNLVAFWISCVQLYLYPCIFIFSWSFGPVPTPSFLRQKLVLLFHLSSFLVLISIKVQLGTTACHQSR